MLDLPQIFSGFSLLFICQSVHMVGTGEWNARLQRWHAWSCLGSLAKCHLLYIMDFSSTFFCHSMYKQWEYSQGNLIRVLMCQVIMNESERVVLIAAKQRGPMSVVSKHLLNSRATEATGKILVDAPGVWSWLQVSSICFHRETSFVT